MKKSHLKRKKILVICPYPEGVAATQRLKYEQYFDSWREQGYEITISPFFSLPTWKILYKEGFLLQKCIGTLMGYVTRFFDLLRLKKFDHVYVCMWVTPLFDTLFERLFLSLSSYLIYDFDDAIHVEEDPSGHNSIRGLLKGKKKINILINRASHVITSSPFNLEYCLLHNQNSSATYIPCSLDTTRFFPATTRNRAKLTVGWTGTFSSKAYLDSIIDFLAPSCIELNLKLVIIGNFDYSVDGVDLEVIQWKESSEIEDLQKIDIGLYPVIPSSWALGKGGLKVLQYMSIGIPSISTNFGTAQKIIEDGVDGFLVNSPEEWKEKISLLARDASLRERLGKHGRNKVIENYSVTSIQKQYLKVLDG
jgi:L-malate glycosyltransferase